MLAAVSKLFTPQRAAIAIAVFLAVLAGFWIEHAPNVGGDTPGLVSGAQVMWTCLSHGQLQSCGVLPGGHRALNLDYPYISAVGPYPLLQYLPALALFSVGASAAQVMSALSLLSIAAFFLLLWAVWTVAARKVSRAWGPVLVLATMAGPLIYYGNSTLGEMVATALLVGVVAAAALGRGKWQIALAALLAGLTKETAFPFIFALGMIGILLTRPRSEWRVRGAYLAAGAVLSFIANSAFNVFRYGTVQNRDYLQSLFQVHSVSTWLKFFAALLVAPNGGVYLFWVGPMVIVTGAVGWGLSRPERRSRLAAGALALVFLVIIGGLALWWAPFGWDSWGPRLTIPWIPALMLLAVLAYGEKMLPALRRLTRTTPTIVAVALAVTAVALPHIGFLFNPAGGDTIFVPDGVCRAIMTPGSAAYYRCVEHQAWGRHMILIGTLDGDGQLPGILFSVTIFLASIGLLVLTRDYFGAGDGATDGSLGHGARHAGPAQLLQEP